MLSSMCQILGHASVAMRICIACVVDPINSPSGNMLFRRQLPFRSSATPPLLAFPLSRLQPSRFGVLDFDIDSSLDRHPPHHKHGATEILDTIERARWIAVALISHPQSSAPSVDRPAVTRQRQRICAPNESRNHGRLAPSRASC